MIQIINTSRNVIIAELSDVNFVINQPQEVLDIIGNLIPINCYKIIINENNIHPDFFDLKTKLAGEILQKFSNYNIQLAIVGDFSKYKSKSLRDFIYESNKSNLVFFAKNKESAILRLENK